MHGMQRYRCSVVCLLDTTVSPTKTAEPIEAPFGLQTRVSPTNHALGGRQDPEREGAVFLGGGGCPPPIEMH